MKARNLLVVVTLTIFFSGCVVYSFYPLYTEKDLFENDILLGEWFEDEDADALYNEINDGVSSWKFEHPFIGDKKKGIRDKRSYTLTLVTEEDGKKMESEFTVHIIKLGGEYFLDFYLEEFMDDDEITLASFHIIPVHTFAKLKVEENKLIINWFDQEWLEELIKENKIRIHHEDNDDFILLTAKPKELQKFVTKYVNSEEAFEDGLSVELYRK
ncbi:MAG: hypothetical protein R3182_03400 [Draconibacterium sp.]|nr:hypothetical protein [Draconibacterium sp.]